MEALGVQNEAARSCFPVSCVLLTECNVSCWQWWRPVISGDPVTPRGRPGPSTADTQISISNNHKKCYFNNIYGALNGLCLHPLVLCCCSVALNIKEVPLFANRGCCSPHSTAQRGGQPGCFSPRHMDETGPITPSVVRIVCLRVRQEHLIRKYQWKQEEDAFSYSFNYGCLTVSGSFLILLPEPSLISRQT